MSGSHENDEGLDETALRVLALIRKKAQEKAKQIEAKEKANRRFSQFDEIKERAMRAITPVKPANKQSIAPRDMLFSAKRTNAGRRLPEPYLVYFLFVDLLGFKDLGRWEKMAYSIPIDFNGVAYLVEHRKMGLGLFAADTESAEDDAVIIVNHIRKAVNAARPYFEHLATEAAEGSQLNLNNHSRSLYDRYIFFQKIFHDKKEEIERRENEIKLGKEKSENGLVKWCSIHMPIVELRREARWIGLAAVEAFFSWTEHVSMHISVLRGKCKTGKEVTQLAGADWSTKIRAALDFDEPETKKIYDELTVIRRQLRNFVTHGAFGNDGEAFSFHSSAGAVPLRLPHRRKQHTFYFGSGMDLDPTRAFGIIASFESYLWSGWREGAKVYIQEYELPTILSMAEDGTYDQVRLSKQTMIDFADNLSQQFDNAVNMDW